jgi:hypothetical protein
LPLDADAVWTAFSVEGADDLGVFGGQALTCITALIRGTGAEGIAAKVAATIEANPRKAAIIIHDTLVVRVGRQSAR